MVFVRLIVVHPQEEWQWNSHTTLWNGNEWKSVQERQKGDYGFCLSFFLFNKCLSDLGKMDGNLRRSSSRILTWLRSFFGVVTSITVFISSCQSTIHEACILLGAFVVLSFPTIRPSLTKLTKLSFPSLSHYLLFQDFHKSFLMGCIQRTEIVIDLCVTNLSYLFGNQNELW